MNNKVNNKTCIWYMVLDGEYEACISKPGKDELACAPCVCEPGCGYEEIISLRRNSHDFENRHFDESSH